ncbi:MAG: DNA mismatch repair protein MutS [Deltaproteobacteria bacterium]|nr:DNA mismatch repair protein MutS [Deltaproteobacteria bacterium]
MLAQYLRLKEQHRDAVLMFRLGDFYEMFFEDAERASAILDITLTARNKHDPNPIPLCGVPFHAVDGYIQKLLAAGLKVAICEQVEDPRGAKGLVDRDVVRVITPGTVLEEESLDPRSASFLAVVARAGDGLGLAACDLSTGEVRVMEFSPAAGRERGATTDAPTRVAADDALDAAAEELARLGAKELVVAPELQAVLPRLTAQAPGVFQSLVPTEWFDAEEGGAWVAASAEGASAVGAGGRAALGGLRAYLRATYRGKLDHLRAPELVRPHDTLILDQTTRSNLNLVDGGGGERRGSLLHVLDRTRTPMGSRMLRRWMLAPLTSPAAIARRLDAVEILVQSVDVREDVRTGLAGMGDLERLVARVGTGSASPRDLTRLVAALARVGALRDNLGGRDDLLGEVAATLDPLPDLQTRIGAMLADEPPATARSGAIIRDGARPEVDELRSLTRDGKGWVAALEARERKRTGIASLKVRYNRVSGYGIEVTKPNLALVPAEYVRKQTLAGAERFVTAELKEQEQKLLGAEARLVQLEAALFAELVAEAATHQRALAENARAVAVLDTLAALADVAHDRGYVRPVLDRGDAVVIRDGRHPVIETTLGGAAFVPNDCTLDASQQVLLITGPNMAGKSTYLRQVALVCCLAQMGSFVPASEARIGVLDRIFTRVGASDNLAAGDSTFMVEMRETANILRELGPRSLVILDEIGRGTSTYDGIAIAWAVAEHLHDREPAAKTLFATHYYELTALARQLPRVRNYSVAVREWNDQVIFLRRIVAGPANRSYGVEVARLAGLPVEVVERARSLLATLERGELLSEGGRTAAAGHPVPGTQLGLFAPRPSAVEARLRAIDVTRMTPLEAMNELHQLVDAVRGGGDDHGTDGRD